MKTGTTKKLKFLRLKRRLQLPEWQVIGLLEALWKVAESNTPQGDIGKLPNDGIAALMEYGEDADQLIEALVAEGWLDPDPEFRLVVHDWSDHCPNHVKGNLKKYSREFADVLAKRRSLGEPPNKEPPLDPPQGSFPPNHNQTKPNHHHHHHQTGPAAERQRQMMMMVKELVSLGLADAQSAADSALGRNCTIDEILAIAHHWHHDGGWPIAVLHWRISNATPGVPADQGWPPKERKARIDRALRNEGRAFSIIKAGRKAKKPEDEIRAELAAAGLEWPQ